MPQATWLRSWAQRTAGGANKRPPSHNVAERLGGFPRVPTDSVLCPWPSPLSFPMCEMVASGCEAHWLSEWRTELYATHFVELPLSAFWALMPCCTVMHVAWGSVWRSLGSLASAGLARWLLAAALRDVYAAVAASWCTVSTRSVCCACAQAVGLTFISIPPSSLCPPPSTRWYY